jgi:hypothetical protein
MIRNNFKTMHERNKMNIPNGTELSRCFEFSPFGILLGLLRISCFEIRIYFVSSLTRGTKTAGLKLRVVP